MEKPDTVWTTDIKLSHKDDIYILPRFDAILDLLPKACMFCALDLISEFWQVEVNKAFQEKTAFVIHHGLFEFEKMPFGLCNAPATFQHLMKIVLADLVRKLYYVSLSE